MSYKQLRTPNINIKTIKLGWCLWWVQEAFKTSHKYAAAINEWEANTYNHTDIPGGLWVPLFFKMRGEPAGHTAIIAPDKSVYSTSSPWSLTPVHHKNIADLNAYYGGRLTYLGWSEDIGGVRVVSPKTSVIKKIIAKISPVKYVVKRGDTLSKIASKYKTTWKNLQNINKIKNANLIYVGQVIRIK